MGRNSQVDERLLVLLARLGLHLLELHNRLEFSLALLLAAGSAVVALVAVLGVRRLRGRPERGGGHTEREATRTAAKGSARAAQGRKRVGWGGRSLRGRSSEWLSRVLRPSPSQAWRCSADRTDVASSDILARTVIQTLATSRGNPLCPEEPMESRGDAGQFGLMECQEQAARGS
jgi:hypothetical protein